MKFAEPEHAGLYASRNFYIYHNDPKTNENALDEAADETQIRLGLWHILPDYIARLSSDSLNVSEVRKLRKSRFIDRLIHILRLQ